MVDKPVEADEAALATRGVTLLHEQADALRVEIARLRQELAELQSAPVIARAPEHVISAQTTRDMCAAAKEERQEQIDFLTAMIQDMRTHHAGICAGAEPVRARGDAALLVRLQEALEHQVARLTR